MDFLDLSGEIIAFLWYFTPYVMTCVQPPLQRQDSYGVQYCPLLFKILDLPLSCMVLRTTLCYYNYTGRFGEIHHAKLKRLNSTVEVIVKTLKKIDDKNEQSDFLKEQSIMSELVHPNIVRFHGITDDGKGGHYSNQG